MMVKSEPDGSHSVEEEKKKRKREVERSRSGEGSGCLGQAVVGGSYQTVINGYLQYFTLL